MRQDTARTGNGHRDESATGWETRHHYTVHEAARLLGLSVDAMRKRAERGSLVRQKAPDGTVYILLDTDHPATRQTTSQGVSDDETLTSQLMESLRDQVEHLRRELNIRNDELRRKDHLLAAALERIPELEVPSEPQGASETASEESEKGRVSQGAQKPSERRERVCR